MRFETILVAITALTGLIWLLAVVFKTKRNWVVEYSKSFFPVLLLVLFLRSFLYEPFRIPSGSMKPTLLEGDFILVNKFNYGIRLPITGTVIIPIGKPKTGDIVVFRHHDGKDLIKRVVGVPGDHIKYENEKLYINDKLVVTKFYQDTHDNGLYTRESIEQLGDVSHKIYVYPNRHLHYVYSDVIVPEGSYFVMGDNRNNSEDSRIWGFVSEKDLLGRAFATWMSWDSQATDVRWSRIGKSIYE